MRLIDLPSSYSDLARSRALVATRYELVCLHSDYPSGGLGSGAAARTVHTSWKVR